MWRLLFLILPAFSSDLPTLTDVQLREWKVLLHYRRASIGEEKSEADSPGFFFSANGKTKAEEELKATILAMDPDSPVRLGELKQHPQCAFPLRWQFIKNHFKTDYSDVECRDFLSWKNSFRAQSVTMVYAAPFFGSPASMFGHTFLRIDSLPRGQNEKSDLLDYGIGFEANPDSGFDPFYIVKGLLGGYEGRFFQYPYHLKVNSYNDLEARDLWEYQLNFSSQEIDRLLSHIWEMGQARFDYFFFDENCSYHLLSLLEAARPTLDLRHRFGVMAIPSDTIRILFEENDLVAKINYRPSLIETLETRLANLSDAERDEFFRVRNQPKLVNPEAKTELLDALLDWNRLQAMKSGRSLGEIDKLLDPTVLRLRAKRPQTAPLSPVPPARIEEGHASSKISMAGGVSRQSTLWEAELRPVLHDELDRDEGYLPQSRLNLMRTRVGFQSEIGVYLQELTVAEVQTLYPYSPIRNNWAWSIGGGLTRPIDIDCVNCLVGDVRGLFGRSWSLLKTPKFLLAIGAGAKGQIQYGGGLVNSYRTSPGLEIFQLWQWANWKAKLSHSYLRHLRFNHHLTEETSLTELTNSLGFEKWELRARLSYLKTLKRENTQGLLEAGFYF